MCVKILYMLKSKVILEGAYGNGTEAKEEINPFADEIPSTYIQAE